MNRHAKAEAVVEVSTTLRRRTVMVLKGDARGASRKTALVGVPGEGF